MPRIKEITLYKFEELSPEAQEKAIDWYRSSNSDSWQFEYEYLTEEIKSNPNYIADFSDEYCMKHNAGLLQEYCKLKAIFSVEIEQLDTYRRDCTIKLSLHSTIVLRQVISDLYSARPLRVKRLLALLDDGRIELYGYDDTVSHYSTRGVSSWLNLICEAIDDSYQSTIQELKTDYEHWILRRMIETEEWLYSEEYVRETIEANEYEFDAEGNRE